MKALRTATLTAAIAIAALALPSGASAEYLVPPGNSAATQYTEAVPTAGGPRDVGDQGRPGNRSPKDVLGGDTARRLEAQGPEGEEAAEVAAATAPVTETSPSQDRDEGIGAVAGGGDSGAGTGAQGAGTDRPATAGDAGEVDGSSGFGEVLAQATGSSSGELGPLLPLLILGTLIWALAVLWRERRKTPTA
jgi:hypothetical protein